MMVLCAAICGCSSVSVYERAARHLVATKSSGARTTYAYWYAIGRSNSEVLASQDPAISSALSHCVTDLHEENSRALPYRRITAERQVTECMKKKGWLLSLETLVVVS